MTRRKKLRDYKPGAFETDPNLPRSLAPKPKYPNERSRNALGGLAVPRPGGIERAEVRRKVEADRMARRMARYGARHPLEGL